MRNSKKIILFFTALLIALTLNVGFVSADTEEVGTESALRQAITDAVDGDVISLTSNIALTSPIEVTGKDITINGNGHTISKVDENWSPNGSNGSLITAGLEGTTLNLVNLKLTGAQKYGAQSYNGAHLTLDGVTISNCGFGAVLVNAGTVEVKDLTLNRNGSPNNNGIEFAKGNSITTGDNIPTLVMNGTLSSTETENVIYLAINDKLSGFDLQNTENTTNKVFINGNTVVVADEKNNILFTSQEFSDDLNFDAPTYTEPTPEEPPKDDTPKTGVKTNIEIAFALLSISTLGIAVLKKKAL